MTKCGCETGGDCTKTTVCQGALEADKLAEVLESLVADVINLVPCILTDAQEALKEYWG